MRTQLFETMGLRNKFKSAVTSGVNKTRIKLSGYERISTKNLLSANDGDDDDGCDGFQYDFGNEVEDAHDDDYYNRKSSKNTDKSSKIDTAVASIEGKRKKKKRPRKKTVDSSIVSNNSDTCGMDILTSREISDIVNLAGSITSGERPQPSPSRPSNSKDGQSSMLSSLSSHSALSIRKAQQQKAENTTYYQEEYAHLWISDRSSKRQDRGNDGNYNGGGEDSATYVLSTRCNSSIVSPLTSSEKSSYESLREIRDKLATRPKLVLGVGIIDEEEKDETTQGSITREMKEEKRKKHRKKGKSSKDEKRALKKKKKKATETKKNKKEKETKQKSRRHQTKDTDKLTRITKYEKEQSEDETEIDANDSESECDAGIGWWNLDGKIDNNKERNIDKKKEDEKKSSRPSSLRSLSEKVLKEVNSLLNHSDRKDHRRKKTEDGTSSMPLKTLNHSSKSGTATDKRKQRRESSAGSKASKNRSRSRSTKRSKEKKTKKSSSPNRRGRKMTQEQQQKRLHRQKSSRSTKKTRRRSSLKEEQSSSDNFTSGLKKMYQ